MVQLTRLRCLVTGLALLAGLTAARADDRTDCTNTATAPAAGIAACSRWIATGQLQGDDLLWAHMWRGFHLTAAGEFDRAIADYNEAIKRDPKLAAAYMGRGANYEGKGELKPALADFRQALAVDPAMADATAAIKRIEGKLAAVTPPPPAAAPPRAAALPPPAAAPSPSAAAPTVAAAPVTGCTRSAWRINNSSPNATAQWTVDANGQCRSTMTWSIPTTTVTLATAPSHGTLTIESNTAMVYTPNPGYQGDDAFAITVQWASGGRNYAGNVKFAVTVK